MLVAASAQRTRRAFRDIRLGIGAHVVVETYSTLNLRPVVSRYRRQNCASLRTAARYSWSIHENSSQNSRCATGVVVLRLVTNIRSAAFR